MAMKPLRPCRHPGCGALTRDGWCPAHRPREKPRSAAWRRWYSLKVWTDDLRPGQLLREPFCRSCAVLRSNRGGAARNRVGGKH